MQVSKHRVGLTTKTTILMLICNCMVARLLSSARAWSAVTTTCVCMETRGQELHPQHRRHLKLGCKLAGLQHGVTCLPLGGGALPAQSEARTPRGLRTPTSTSFHGVSSPEAPYPTLLMLRARARTSERSASTSAAAAGAGCAASCALRPSNSCAMLSTWRQHEDDDLDSSNGLGTVKSAWQARVARQVGGLVRPECAPCFSLCHAVS